MQKEKEQEVRGRNDKKQKEKHVATKRGGGAGNPKSREGK